MVAAIARTAKERGLKVAVAESLTCGGLVHALGAGEDSSEWLAGGVVAYMMATKVDVLGVEPDVDPCSKECAEQLAAGVRRLLQADIAVATTGVGGSEPEGGHPPGEVWIGWATADRAGAKGYRFEGEPEEVIEASVRAGLGALAEGIREHLTSRLA